MANAPLKMSSLLVSHNSLGASVQSPQRPAASTAKVTTDDVTKIYEDIMQRTLKAYKEQCKEALDRRERILKQFYELSGGAPIPDLVPFHELTEKYTNTVNSSQDVNFLVSSLILIETDIEVLTRMFNGHVARSADSKRKSSKTGGGGVV